MATEEEQRKLEFDAAWESGVVHGLGMYAWWKEGTQFVGTTGTTLHEAVKRFRTEQRAESSRSRLSTRLNATVDMSVAIRTVLQQYSVDGTHINDLPDDVLEAVLPIVSAYQADLEGERDRRIANA